MLKSRLATPAIPAGSVTLITRHAGPPGSSPAGVCCRVNPSVLPLRSVTAVGNPSVLNQKVTLSGRVSAQCRSGGLASMLRRYRFTPAGSVQRVDPSGWVAPVKRWVVPSPSMSSTHLLLRPLTWSALLGWTSSDSPRRVSPLIASEKLLPAGLLEWSSSEL
jgi:hypothetical protein